MFYGYPTVILVRLSNEGKKFLPQRITDRQTRNWTHSDRKFATMRKENVAEISMNLLDMSVYYRKNELTRTRGSFFATGQRLSSREVQFTTIFV